jgi:hypothetical protein
MSSFNKYNNNSQNISKDSSGLGLGANGGSFRIYNVKES